MSNFSVINLPAHPASLMHKMSKKVHKWVLGASIWTKTFVSCPGLLSSLFWQLSVDLNKDVYHQVKHRLQAPTLQCSLESLAFHIGFPVVQTDPKTNGHVIIKISRIDRLPNFIGMGPHLHARFAHMELLYGRKLKGAFKNLKNNANNWMNGKAYQNMHWKLLEKPDILRVLPLDWSLLNHWGRGLEAPLKCQVFPTFLMHTMYFDELCHSLDEMCPCLIISCHVGV